MLNYYPRGLSILFPPHPIPSFLPPVITHSKSFHLSPLLQPHTSRTSHLVVGVNTIAQRRIANARSTNKIAIIARLISGLVASGIEGEVEARSHFGDSEASLSHGKVVLNWCAVPPDHISDPTAVYCTL